MRGPRLCVTLPARTLAGAVRGIAAARQDGADLVELRLDRWPAEERRRLAELFPAALPLVATYRSIAEGGEGSADPEERARLLVELRALPFERIDREVARDAPPGPDDAPRSIGSRHLAAPVHWSSFPEMALRGRVAEELRKTVAPATVSEFLRDVLPLPWEGGGGIVHTQGPSGPLSRLWPERLGTPWVFCAPGPSDPSSGEPVDPSQPPVDRLASTLRASPPGPFFALLGHPVHHSLSPRLHHTWLRDGQRRGLYVALDVETEREFRDLLDRLPQGGFRGVNVTHPWKELALTVSPRAEPGATEAGAANCLTWDGGSWTAALTDLEAVERRLLELRREGSWDGNELALLGSGGAARATLVASRRLGASVKLWTRRPEAFEALARRFPTTVRPPSRGGCGLAVQATPVGRKNAGELDPAALELLRSALYCLDFVYAPDAPIVGEAVESGGGTYEDGTRLLRYQAEESFRRWWGARPDGAGAPEALEALEAP